MKNAPHHFHIPVMGLGYTLDTPIKVAKYGIDSVISIVQDDVIEKARAYYSRLNDRSYTPINRDQKAYRSNRITAYLNLVNELVDESFKKLVATPSELEKYARLLPGDRSVSWLLRHQKLLCKGSIDVNIMTKLDRQPSTDETVLTEACSALKGYAESDLDSSLVLSAGLNPRLFAFMQQFGDFFPDKNGYIKKRIVVKVSDFRSALLQGKILAKKGLWVAEYRIESGLNCGGHTFATEGLLLGPILEEFKQHRKAMLQEQWDLCRSAWTESGRHHLTHPKQRVTVQGGLGHSSERKLMETYFGTDATGWGSPFLLVPEATSVDDTTLQELIRAGEQDIYNSGISPLGIRFNTIRNNSGEQQKRNRIASGKPGSPCVRKHLAFDQTYNKLGMCTASAQYQKRKIKELDAQELAPHDYEEAYLKIVEKECICEGLATSFLKKFDLKTNNNTGVSICPGPNLAYFNRTYSLEEMVGHIYGKKQVLEMDRPHVLIKELELYLGFFRELQEDFTGLESPHPKEEKRLQKFNENLRDGIVYYEKLVAFIPFESPVERTKFLNALKSAKQSLESYREMPV